MVATQIRDAPYDYSRTTVSNGMSLKASSVGVSSRTAVVRSVVVVGLLIAAFSQRVLGIQCLRVRRSWLVDERARL